MTVAEAGHIMRCACCKTLKGRAHKMSCSYQYTAETKKRQQWERVPMPPRTNK